MKTNRELILFCMNHRACDVAWLNQFSDETPIVDVYRALPANLGTHLTWIMRHLCAPYCLIDERYVKFVASFKAFRTGCFAPKYRALVTERDGDQEIHEAFENLEDAIAPEWSAWKQSFEADFMALVEAIP